MPITCLEFFEKRNFQMKMQRLQVKITQFSQKNIKLDVFRQKTKRRQDIMPRRLLNAKFLALVTS